MTPIYIKNPTFNASNVYCHEFISKFLVVSESIKTKGPQLILFSHTQLSQLIKPNQTCKQCRKQSAKHQNCYSLVYSFLINAQNWRPSLTLSGRGGGTFFKHPFLHETSISP